MTLGLIIALVALALILLAMIACAWVISAAVQFAEDAEEPDFCGWIHEPRPLSDPLQNIREDEIEGQGLVSAGRG